MCSTIYLSLSMWAIWCTLLMFSKLCLSEDHPSSTDPQDAAALWSLMSYWQNVPPSWNNSHDPCDNQTPWEGITCSDGRVKWLHLSSMDIVGTLGDDIGNLAELTSLDLSYNKEIGGFLTPHIGKLGNLQDLILTGCSFTGRIPPELGDLKKLKVLALNSNNFSETIPGELGFLQNLYWLDLADNWLFGHLPIHNYASPGLDNLVETKYFYFSKNQLNGLIDEIFFSSINPIELLLDGNQFRGSIPESIGHMQTLQALRMDDNQFTNRVPDSITNLTSLRELNLAGNKLSGPMPDLSKMTQLKYVNLAGNKLNGPMPDLSKMAELKYVNLSKNLFDASPAPKSFWKMKSLTTLVLEDVGLYGEVPIFLFTSPQLRQVILDNNRLNGTLVCSTNATSALKLLSLQNNAISSANISSGIDTVIVLIGNPLCYSNAVSNDEYCSLQQKKIAPYSTSLVRCNSSSCITGQSVHPQNCSCAYPHKGVMVFRAPLLTDSTNSTLFEQLETQLQRKIILGPGFVYLSDIFFNSDAYLHVHVKFFPSSGPYFNRSDIIHINYALTSDPYTHLEEFGRYYFLADPYSFPGASATNENTRKSSMKAAAKAGIAVSCAAIVIAFVMLGHHTIQKKNKSQRACKPTAQYDGRSTSLFQKVTQFSLDELKMCTDNFSESYEIGVGGFGKVYRGSLLNGQMVAIKRLQIGSAQGDVEFKTEIELLSRVHHKNLVNLVGFCVEQDEQILVYEYIPNGTLRESLNRRDGMQLDWNRRLQIALGSARGLAYLHELANPPIIHRDIKSANILLDRNFNAKVSDFGLSKLVSDSQKWHVSSQVKGTLGYLDPEYYMTQVLTAKSDVYSFGVVMLELITSRKPIENGNHVAREVLMAINEYDEKFYGLEGIMDSSIKDEASHASLRRFLHLSMACLLQSPSNRPTMAEVVQEIDRILKNEGTGTSSKFAALSITQIRNERAMARSLLHSEEIPIREESDSAFEYSDGQRRYSSKI